MAQRKETATQSEHAITEVTSVVSHQLKTPLSAIRSSLEVLLSGDLGALTKDQQEYIQLAHTSVEKMIALVKNLLDASRIDENRFKLDPVPTDLVAIVQEVVDEAKTFAMAKNTTLEFKHSGDIPKLTVDALKIQQVVNNLVYNAIRYSKGKGEVVLHVVKDGDTVKFTCQDNGIGVPAEESSKMFTKFYRSPRVVAIAPDGSGLGLYIAKAIIEQSGGKIWFESKIDSGTTFYFTLPIK